MSHNSTVSGTSIYSKELIESAISALQAQGLNIELLANTKPRMYYNHQHPAPADLCIRVKDSKYDIALDWNSETEEYDIVFDDWAKEVAKVMGVTLPSGKWSNSEKTMASVAKFIREYNIALVKQEAKEKGFEYYSDTAENGETTFTLNTNDQVATANVG